jgi:hypothetical protein
MKKTNAINLVLITAAMTACNRPLYQQRPDGYDDPGYSTGAPAGPLTAGPDSRAPADAADSTNSCPVESSELPPDYYDWYNGAGAFGSFTVNFNINGFYAYRNPLPLVRVNPVRSFFARAFANIPHPMAPNRVAPYPMENHPASVHNSPASTHPTVARSGFGARVGMAVHS